MKTAAQKISEVAGHALHPATRTTHRYVYAALAVAYALGDVADAIRSLKANEDPQE